MGNSSSENWQKMKKAAHSVVNRFQVEFTRNIKKPQETARIIARDLTEMGVDPAQIQARWKSFSKQWTKNQQPRPHDFIQFCRYIDGGQTQSRPEVDCQWCKGSGLQTIARPRDEKKQWRPYLEEFNYQRPWRKTPVYTLAVPCDCAASHGSPPGELAQLRNRARYTYIQSEIRGYMNWLHSWLRKSSARNPGDGGNIGPELEKMKKVCQNIIGSGDEQPESQDDDFENIGADTPF